MFAILWGIRYGRFSETKENAFATVFLAEFEFCPAGLDAYGADHSACVGADVFLLRGGDWRFLGASLPG